jgi:hypothetical protein
MAVFEPVLGPHVLEGAVEVEALEIVGALDMVQKRETLQAPEAVLKLEAYNVPGVLMVANARAVVGLLLLEAAMMWSLPQDLAL